jgi:hypothetical protein
MLLDVVGVNVIKVDRCLTGLWIADSCVHLSNDVGWTRVVVVVVVVGGSGGGGGGGGGVVWTQFTW